MKTTSDKPAAAKPSSLQRRHLFRRLRITSQILFFSLFVVTFFFINRSEASLHPCSAWLLKLNPLVGLITSIASRTIVTVVIVSSIVTALATIFFGRIFCGFACPLGALIDFSDRFLFGKLRSAKRRPPLYLQKLKYVFLITLLTLSVFGILFPLFMDPILLITRFFTLLLHPAGLTAAEGTMRWLGENAPKFSTVHFVGGGLTFVLFAVVIGGGFWDRRFWCQYICPSGAFFGLLSRFTMLRRSSNEECCCNCGGCAKRTCPVRAIDEKTPAKTSVAECILCGKCFEDKRLCSIPYFGLAALATTTGPDLQRRHAVIGIASGLVSLSVLKADARRDNRRGAVVRPPTACDEELFLQLCLTCGQCMKVCPNNALQPCTFTDGFFRINTPKLLPAVGYCDPKCTACGSVCPTGALLPVTRADKPFTKTGTAIIDRGICTVWKGTSSCITCSRVCPYNAISLTDITINGEMLTVPVVDETCCTGCGKCEALCPVRPLAAITVVPEGQRYRRPPVTDRKREQIIARRREIAEK
jgi:polyferredoxin